MPTEYVDPRFTDLDAWPLANAIDAMWEGQMAAVGAVQAALPSITAATQAAADRLKSGGRLIYAGAGTSGRIAAQDGAELTPTFDWPPARTVFALAGGAAALLASVEGAEDNSADGAGQIDAAGVNANDVVIGVAASGKTPFTLAAIQRGAERGALTIGIANNAATPLLAAAHHAILIATGAELVAGSTRMKAGTAQKIVLNLISTGIMLRLGRVYRGLMVNMQTANAKLRSRAEDIVMRITDCAHPIAAEALKKADGNIKLATLIALGRTRADAEAMLARHDGNLRHALTAYGITG